MAAETAMGASFRKSGVVPLKVELRVALSRFHNLGLSFNDMRAELDDLERMSGMGQSNCASNGPNRPAQTRQQVEGGAGQIFNSRKGHDLVASPPSSNHDERGQTRIASSGQTVAASSRRVPDRGGEGQVHSVPAHQTVRALPVSEPSASYLKAVGESRLQSARHVLYKHRTSTGHWWGDIHPYEVAGMTRDSVRGMALMSVLGPLNPKQMKMTFGQLLTPKQAEIALSKADKEIAHVEG